VITEAERRLEPALAVDRLAGVIVSAAGDQHRGDRCGGPMAEMDALEHCLES
jgi:hypothetical protein